MDIDLSWIHNPTILGEVSFPYNSGQSEYKLSLPNSTTAGVRIFYKKFNKPCMEGTLTGTLSWLFCKGWKLSIIGNGIIPKYEIGYQPWFKIKDKIHSIVFGSGTKDNSGITEIGEHAFSGCNALTDIFIPESVTKIGDYAFAWCCALKSITVLNPNPVDINPNVFDEIDKSACTLHVLPEAVEAYKNAEVWKEFIITGNATGIETVEKPEDVITVYPNPTTGQLTIENGKWKMENVEIFDVYGRNVETKFPSNSLEGWQPQADGVVLNISHLPAGVYFVKILTEKGVVMKKVVKQ
jgi:hypothetical protein